MSDALRRIEEKHQRDLDGDTPGECFGCMGNLGHGPCDVVKLARALVEVSDEVYKDKRKAIVERVLEEVAGGENV